MKLTIALVVAALIITAAVVVSGTPDQTAEAKSVRKVHFTETVQSSSDPGKGNKGQQMAVLLSPNPGTIYVGTVTYTASIPIKIMILHELDDGDDGNQPVWTINDDTKYAVTFLELGASGTATFAGAALALHSEQNSFTATASVDGWVRGDPIDVVVQTKLVSAADQHPELKLARTILPVTLPMHTGFYDGEDVYYVITDSSTQKYADEISQWQNYNVTAAPLLEETPETALGKVYLFKNGKSGEGLYGYQQEIFSGTPEQQMYGSLRLAVVAEWNQGQKKSVIESEKDLLEQVKNGRIVLDESETILNIPQIKWPGGQMPQIENLTMADYEESPYGSGSQILSFDEENMSVTLVSHREWAEDGRTLYCIPFDSTPEKPATLMGLVNAPASSILANSDAAADYYEFKNGISGSGLLGFQPSLRYGIPGSENYSPIQKINIVEWINPGEAQILATENDLNDAYANESITITQARPLNSDHIINCPVVYPVMEHHAENKTAEDDNS